MYVGFLTWFYAKLYVHFFTNIYVSSHFFSFYHAAYFLFMYVVWWIKSWRREERRSGKKKVGKDGKMTCNEDEDLKQEFVCLQICSWLALSISQKKRSEKKTQFLFRNPLINNIYEEVFIR